MQWYILKYIQEMKKKLKENFVQLEKKGMKDNLEKSDLLKKLLK